MRILYFDCFSGISGDMTLGALVDAGADKHAIEAGLAKLALDPFTIQWNHVVKRGISATKADVVPDNKSHGHRHYSDIVKMIEQADLEKSVKETSLAIFQKIGEAEAKIHNISLEKVHFHEVGAVDSIVDVVGTAIALHQLAVDRIIASPVPLGSGTVRCDHGLYPVPAPATLEMMKGLPVAPTKHSVELTTPTGAGIIAGTVQQFSRGLPSMIVEEIGYGAGTRDLEDQPNVLRVVIGKSKSSLPLWPVSMQAISQESQPHEHHHHSHHHPHG